MRSISVSVVSLVAADKTRGRNRPGHRRGRKVEKAMSAIRVEFRVGDFVIIGAAKRITVIVPLSLLRTTEEGVARGQTIFLFARGVVSTRVPPRRLTERRSEIIARYQSRSEESFISDFWAAEARKSDTRPLSRNFGRLIITSRRGALARTRCQ